MQMSQGYRGCHQDIYRCFKDVRTTYGLDTDELQIIITPNICKPFTEKIKLFDFSMECLRTSCIRDGSHKDNRDDTDEYTDVKYDP